MRFASNQSGLCAAVLGLTLAGCAGTPLAGINPALRREWAQDEKYGQTIHTKLKDLAHVRATARNYSPQQQEELGNFRQKEGEVKTELKDVRKNLRADIDSLENRIKWLNIAGMPALVALTGLLFAVVKRRRSAAR